ncbi:unnamed protein product [Protopolystoma xenopodis]|uniref:Uncharacterized protein n=1 Tax=Protopolystoma xenopodis TaxID=117903 RepID=A0A3S5BEQ9_9PLAT|nr:unnamed protein product [Protopolystoma xenopodis]
MQTRQTWTNRPSGEPGDESGEGVEAGGQCFAARRDEDGRKAVCTRRKTTLFWACGLWHTKLAVRRELTPSRLDSVTFAASQQAPGMLLACETECNPSARPFGTDRLRPARPSESVASRTVSKAARAKDVSRVKRSEVEWSGVWRTRQQVGLAGVAVVGHAERPRNDANVDAKKSCLWGRTTSQTKRPVATATVDPDCAGLDRVQHERPRPVARTDEWTNEELPKPLRGGHACAGVRQMRACRRTEPSSTPRKQSEWTLGSRHCGRSGDEVEPNTGLLHFRCQDVIQFTITTTSNTNTHIYASSYSLVKHRRQHR